MTKDLNNEIQEDMKKKNEEMLNACSNETAYWFQNLRNKQDKVDECLLLLEQLKKEISHLKAGSIAHISQVTTISKMRILAPLQKGHLLYGVRLSNKDLDLIDQILAERFLKK